MELPYHTKAGTIKTASQKIQKKVCNGTFEPLCLMQNCILKEF